MSFQFLLTVPCAFCHHHRNELLLLTNGSARLRERNRLRRHERLLHSTMEGVVTDSGEERSAEYGLGLCVLSPSSSSCKSRRAAASRARRRRSSAGELVVVVVVVVVGAASGPSKSTTSSLVGRASAGRLDDGDPRDILESLPMTMMGTTIF